MGSQNWGSTPNARTASILTAAELLGRYSDSESESARLKALQDSNALVRAAAARTMVAQRDNNLPGVEPGRVAEALVPLLDDPVRAVRIAAARQLAGARSWNLRVYEREILREKQAALDEAIEEFKQAQLASADRGGAHLVLSSLYQDLGNFPAAAEELRTAIRLEPYLPHARRNLALLLEQLGAAPEEVLTLREEEAEVLAHNVALLPENPELRADLATMRYILGDVSEATKQLEKACQLAPDQYGYRLLVTELYVKQQQWEEAERSASLLLEIAPDDPQAAQLLQGVRLQRENRKETNEPRDK